MSAGRVAVVGAGPRAAQALERLAAHTLRAGVEPPSVDVVAPGLGLGAGEVYATDQPAWLRLNVASASVDAWHDPSGDPRGPDLDTWRRAHGSDPADQFPARALVGAYLDEAAAAVRAELPGDRVGARAVGLTRSPEGWTVRLEGGAAAGPYDEVLLAVGHARDWDGALHRTALGDDPRLVPAVFPVTALMGRCAGLGDRDAVVVRGAALTGLDAALTVAESGGARTLLVSRTGRLMMPKTDPEVLSAHPRWQEAGVYARTRAAAGDPVLDTVTSTAEVLLGDRRGVEQARDALLAPGSACWDTDPRAWLREAVAMASGERPGDGLWALGQAWRLAYAALVDRQHRLAPGTRTLDWPGYARWAPELERLAFGPPLVNATALARLMDEGRVEVATGPVSAHAHRRDVALVVDAVLPPPGVRGVRDPLVRSLLGEGHAEVAVHGRGVVVDRDAASLVGARRVPGLSVVGRLTEDVVLGNDTLVRSLHPHLDAWARRVVGVRDRVAEAAHG